jgi:hypothetical protein
MQQTQSEPVQLSQMVIDCNTQIEQAYKLVTSALIAGCSDKRGVLQAFESFELNYHLCCDISDRCVATAIDLDTSATDEERDNLTCKVHGIQRRWGEMLFHIECGIRLFGVVQMPTQMVH